MGTESPIMNAASSASSSDQSGSSAIITIMSSTDPKVSIVSQVVMPRSISWESLAAGYFSCAAERNAPYGDAVVVVVCL